MRRAACHSKTDQYRPGQINTCQARSIQTRTDQDRHTAGLQFPAVFINCGISTQLISYLSTAVLSIALYFHKTCSVLLQMLFSRYPVENCPQGQTSTCTLIQQTFTGSTEPLSMIFQQSCLGYIKRLCLRTLQHLFIPGTLWNFYHRVRPPLLSLCGLFCKTRSGI